MTRRAFADIIISGIIVLCGAVFLVMAKFGEPAVFASVDGVYRKRIVVDAGHGLPDAGAVGASGTKEEEVNLQIAERLAICLEDKGFEVIMTRTDHSAIGETKDADMVERRRIISESSQAATVSIHQNIFEGDNSVYGAQVFFAPGSDEGEKLAASIQAQLNAALLPEKPRTEHVGNYYIVKSGAPPAVIVECGFISNPEEEILLKKSQYQIKIALAIVKGLCEYLGG